MPDSTSDIDAIRRRPGMYIGDVHDGRALLHMVWELVANALDEHYRGACRSIAVEILEDGSIAVQDDGRGIAIHEQKGRPFAELALTTYHNTPTLDGHAPHEHVGLHGVGIVAVNALSSWLRLDVFRDGSHFRQRYERGIPVTRIDVIEPTDRTGTRITFLPDPEIFPDTLVNGGAIALRLRELACLVPSLTLSFVDRRRFRFHEPDGLLALLRQKCGPSDARLGSMAVSQVVNDIFVEGVMEWHDKPWSSIDSYANIQRTTDGGAHVQGLLNGLALGLRSAARARLGGLSLEKIRQIVSRGLYAIVCVRLRDPTYDQPTRSRLVTPAAKRAVETAVRAAFEQHLRTNAPLLARLSSLNEGSQ